MSDREPRLALHRRLDRVVSYFTPLEPATADTFMCQFFIDYEDLAQLERLVASAERAMADDLAARRADGGRSPG